MITRNGSANGIFTKRIIRHALIVALLVGTLLNFINQGDALIANKNVSFLKIFLTYCVPFFVALYGAYCARVKPSQS